MAGKERTAETVIGSLKSEEALSIIQKTEKYQSEYNASLLRLKKLSATTEKAKQALLEAKEEQRAGLEEKLGNYEKEFDAVIKEAENGLNNLIEASEAKRDFLQELLKRMTGLYGLETASVRTDANGLEQKKARAELELAEAALNDINEKLKQLKKYKQDGGKKGHNPAQPLKAPRRIDKAGLVEEIVAVLAEAEKVKTTKNEIINEEKKSKSASKSADSVSKAGASKSTAVKSEALKGDAKEAGRYRLKTLYSEKVCEALKKQFNYKNINEVPRLEKILLNMGLGDVKDDAKKFAGAVDELKTIAGQKPVITRAKKSIANFKLRQGMNIGAKVTLRGNHMYEFLDKLISIALPRVRDFKGLNPHSFDGRGNYAMGVKEQLIFPEIKYDKVDKVRGFDICIVTTAKTDEEAKALLMQLGLPIKA